MRNLTAQPDSKLIILFVKGGAIAAYCAANRKITRVIFHTDDLGHDLAGLSETVMNISYLDVPIQKIGRFMELHEQVTNMALGEKRTLQGQWVMSHYYGSGPSIVVQDNYASANDAINDDPWVHIREK